MNGKHLRRFTCHEWHGKSVLDTWSQRRCEKCKRFLSRFQRRWCKECGEKIAKEIRIKSKERNEYKISNRLYCREYYQRNKK